MKIYFDANVLIRAIESEDSVAGRLSHMLDRAEDGECEIVTSELSLAETMVGPLKVLQQVPGDPISVERTRLYRSFAENHGAVGHLPVDRAVLIEAARLRASRPALKLPDAIHLATHAISGCDVFLSGDKRLSKTAMSDPSMRGSVVALDDDELAALNHRIHG